MKAGRWRLRRLCVPGVTPIEAWNLPVEGAELWQALGRPRVEAMEREGRAEDEIGRALASALIAALHQMRERRPFDRAFLGGGLLEQPGLEVAVRKAGLPFAVDFNGDRAFAGEAGGRALLREHGGPGGAVVDVGQTSLKLSAPGLRLLRPRDLEALPVRLIGRPRPPATPEGTAAFARFIAEGIAELLTAASPPDPLIVLALPCPLGDDLTPGPCTYGWEGHHGLLPEVFRLIDERFPPWPQTAHPEALILNDAELAAVSARVVLSPRPGTRVLALTLGFGPGAALLEA